MSEEIAIRTEHLCKKYKLYGSPTDRLREWIHRGKRSYHREVWGLRDVTFTVPRGMTVGLVGSNGAGKSTLLKVLSGTTLPSSGHHEVHGKVASLLELGTGFYEGFTGLQNLYMNGMVMGFTRKEMHAKIPSIIEFSELGDFIHQPIRTYSTGMVMRLAFSVATAIDPDVLIIDEILAVGDLHFQKRCIDRIMSFRKSGKTILFCSHSIYQVEEICDKTLWIQNGELRMIGPSQPVVRSYENFERGRRGTDLINRISGPGISQKGEDSDPLIGAPAPSGTDAGNNGGGDPKRLPRILAVRLKDPRTKAVVDRARLLEDLLVEIDYELPHDLSGCVVGITINRSDQVIIAGLGTNLSGLSAPGRHGYYRAELYMPRLHLLHGDYSLVAYLTDERGIHIYHSKRLAAPFAVDQPTRHVGIIWLDHEWKVNPISATELGPE